ncbi:uncharacterized protein LOC102807078 [Saccoglossus kowalevskii]
MKLTILNIVAILNAFTVAMAAFNTDDWEVKQYICEDDFMPAVIHVCRTSVERDNVRAHRKNVNALRSLLHPKVRRSVYEELNRLVNEQATLHEMCCRTCSLLFIEFYVGLTNFC